MKTADRGRGRGISHRGRCVFAALSLAASAACTPAWALCAIRFSAALADLGQATRATLTDAGFPGYRQLGTPRSGIVAVQCDVHRTTLGLRFSQLAPRGGGLLAWNASQPVGALQLRIVRATAEGAQVALLGPDHTPVAALDLVADGEQVALDLHAVAGGARLFTLEIRMTGLVESTYVPVDALRFAMSPRVEIVDP